MELISRQAAIDAINHICPVDTEYDCTLLDRVDVRYVLSELPSAQPEIIRCKDCKHRYIENEIWTCPFGLAGGPDFYCGYGAERRTDEQT